MRASLIFARHGNAQDRQGATACEPSAWGLSRRGAAEACALADWLSGCGVTRLYSSDLARAVETAGVISRLNDVSVHTSSALRERSMGLFEGLSHEQLLLTRAAQGLSNEDPYQDWHGATGVETDEQVHGRVSAFLQAQSALSWEEHGATVLVTHAGVIKSFLHTVFSVTHTQRSCFKIGTGCAAEFTCRRGFPQLIGLWRNPVGL